MCSRSSRSCVLLFVALVFSGCAADVPANADLIESAKAVIASHEQYVAAGDLEGVMTNVHPEILALTVGAPLVRGADETRDFYAGLLGMGAWSFTHDYQGSNVAGDVVELFGVARGTLTPVGAAAASFENNFLLQLRRGEDGRMKVWRAAFAPLAP
jgi:ketosteroid isomerase-like protein